jgi:hypothetical protein
MKDEQFRKVIIKSEADLPKETGIYTVHTVQGLHEWRFDIHNKTRIGLMGSSTDEWLPVVDWYLQPISDTRDAVIEKMEELVEWLEVECQSSETADLSHSFAECLMIKLAEISYLKVNALQSESKEGDNPIAFEFHNYVTGHCYVDYISHVGKEEKDGYTKIPLYK